MGKVIKFEDHVCRLRLPEGEEDAIISYIRKKAAKSGISEEEYLTGLIVKDYREFQERLSELVGRYEQAVSMEPDKREQIFEDYLQEAAAFLYGS